MCISLEDAPAPKQQIACTRSFGQPILELSELIEAISEFATRAAEKLRRQSSVAGQILVFVHTSPFRPGPRFSQSVVMPLRRPTADTSLLVQAAVRGITSIYRPGFQLAKAGVMLLELISDTVCQGELDLESDRGNNRTRLLSAFDAINERFGRGSISMASAGLNNTQRGWAMRQDRLTPQYTTQWSDLPLARA